MVLLLLWVDAMASVPCMLQIDVMASVPCMLWVVMGLVSCILAKCNNRLCTFQECTRRHIYMHCALNEFISEGSMILMTRLVGRFRVDMIEIAVHHNGFT